MSTASWDALYRQLQIISLEVNRVYSEVLPLTKEFLILFTVIILISVIHFQVGLILKLMAGVSTAVVLLTYTQILCQMSAFEKRFYELIQARRNWNWTRLARQQCRSLSRIRFRYGRFGWYSWNVVGYMYNSIADYTIALLLFSKS